MVRKLRGKIILDADTEPGAKKAKEDIDSVEESASGLAEAFGVGGLGLAGAAAGAGAALVAVAADALQNAREIENLSNISGASAETLQKWGRAARESGGSAEDAADAARELQLRLAEATALGSGPAVDALDLLGVSLEDLQDIPIDEKLELIRSRLSNVSDESQRLFLAEELLGGSSERLASVIGATAEEIANQTVVSDEATQQLADMEERFESLTNTLKVEVAEAVSDVSLAVEGLGIIFGDAAKAIGVQGDAGSATESLFQFSTLLGPLIDKTLELRDALAEGRAEAVLLAAALDSTNLRLLTAKERADAAGRAVEATGEKMDTAALKAYTLAVGYQSAALGAYDYAFGLQAIDRAEAGANPLPSLASRLDNASLLTTLPYTPPAVAAAVVVAVPAVVATIRPNR